MERLTFVLLMAAIVLLPLVPAYVLFKYLHSKAKLTGPLAGFNAVLGLASTGGLLSDVQRGDRKSVV
jgi:hypothetical protein